MTEPVRHDVCEGVTLYQGDALSVMPMLPADSVDAVVTDPPYGINTKSDGMGKLSPWADLCNSAYWYAAWIRECRRVLKPTGSLWSCLSWRSLVTFQKASCDVGWPIESLMVWDKCWIGPGGDKGLRPSYEMVGLWAGPDFLLKDRGLPDVQRFKWSAHKPTGHPAEKPLELALFCVNHGCAPGGLVLDPFMGSATTGLACLHSGRRFVGVEMDPAWHQFAGRRLSGKRAPLNISGPLFDRAPEDTP